jgi:FkbM family methyltransferase
VSDDDQALLVFPFAGPDAEIRGDSRDTGVLTTIRETGEYEPHIMTVFAAVLRPDAVCFDVGANIGAHTLAMACLAPAGVVVAVELEPTTADHLAGNVARNLAEDGAADVRIRRVGLHRREGTLTLHTSAAHPGGAFTATTDSHDVGSVDVPVTTLDRLVAEEGLTRVDLIKIDVEGAERDVLSGAAATLESHRPVVIAECNPIALWRFQRVRSGELLEQLSRLCGPVGHVGHDGTVHPIHNALHLDALLGQCGLVDLAAGVPMESDRPARWRWMLFGLVPAPARRRLRRLRRLFHRWQGAAAEQRYIGTEVGSVTVTVDALQLAVGERRNIEVQILNRSDVWLSSDFPSAPIHVGSRVQGEVGAEPVEGPRGRLDSGSSPAIVVGLRWRSRHRIGSETMSSRSASCRRDTAGSSISTGVLRLRFS